MKILLIGDIVGNPGREAVRALVPQLRRRHDLDLVVANCENIAGGAGVTPKTAQELFGSGVDFLTSGQHIWRYKEIMPYLNQEPRLIRPANYPPGAPGAGAGIIAARDGTKVGVLNLVGRVFLETVDCPFRAAQREVERLRRETPVILVDMHAEATSEKIAMGWYLDGQVSAVVGTHTHIQTADERVLPKGTAYLTDLGMTGPYDSVIGRRVDQIIERFLTGIPQKFEVPETNVILCGAILEVDAKTGRAERLERVQERLLPL
ncbi:MAG: metallophosphoesterase [Omnitrophica WOR_2 bacterium RIFCSPHIGHO2_02_FULL_68_15]|nr:MAG: metallophosphoesterase [Omnitrophica WOR_2 bacterium RIFCSPHIGHO2_02_FULL_68_15]